MQDSWQQDEDLQGQIEELKKRLAELQSEQDRLVQTGGAAVAGNVSTGGGDFIGRDQILAALGDGSMIIGGDARGLFVITGDGNTVTLLPDQVPPETLMRAYYSALRLECARLPLGIVDPRFLKPGDQGKVSLALPRGLLRAVGERGRVGEGRPRDEGPPLAVG